MSQPINPQELARLDQLCAAADEFLKGATDDLRTHRNAPHTLMRTDLDALAFMVARTAVLVQEDPLQAAILLARSIERASRK